MLRHILVALALPLGLVAAQTGPVRVTITSVNNAEFRLVGFATDSSVKPIMGRARGIVDLVLGAREAISIAPTDSTARVHVEVAENGRLIGSGDGRFVTVTKDSAGVSLEVQDRAPRSLDPRKPDEMSLLRALAKELKKPPRS